MISEKCLRRATGHIALLRFFPAANDDALAALAEVLAELCADDERLEKAMAAVAKECVEWTGVGGLRQTIREALRPAWKPKCVKCGDLGLWLDGGGYKPCDCRLACLSLEPLW